MKLDLERLLKGARNIYVEGECNTPKREKMLERAMASISKDGAQAFTTGYVGMKNYAGFGDQEVSCEYGMGPTHGSVVYSIGRTSTGRDENAVLGMDELYYLECARDFKPIQLTPSGSHEEKWFDLDDLIRHYREVKWDYEVTSKALKGFEPNIQGTYK